LRQFDVIANPSPRSRAIAPWVVVLQSHHLAAMPTAVVAPLLGFQEEAAYSDTSVVVEFLGERHIVSVAELAAIDARRLPRPAGSLLSEEPAIRRALERLFTGF